MPMRDTRTPEQRTADAFAHADEVEPIFRQAVIGERADDVLAAIPYVAVPADSEYRYERKTELPHVTFTEPAPGYEKAETHQGLPVAGYKKEQPAYAVALVNVNKALEEAVLRQIDHLKVKYSGEFDQRDIAIAKTGIEDAFMRLNRSIFQPERIESGPESDKATQILRVAGSRAALSVEELEAGT